MYGGRILRLKGQTVSSRSRVACLSNGELVPTKLYGRTGMFNYVCTPSDAVVVNLFKFEGNKFRMVLVSTTPEVDQHEAEKAGSAGSKRRSSRPGEE